VKHSRRLLGEPDLDTMVFATATYVTEVEHSHRARRMPNRRRGRLWPWYSPFAI
jgi:hypothetical protein